MGWPWLLLLCRGWLAGARTHPLKCARGRTNTERRNHASTEAGLQQCTTVVVPKPQPPSQMRAGTPVGPGGLQDVFGSMRVLQALPLSRPSVFRCDLPSSGASCEAGGVRLNGLCTHRAAAPCVLFACDDVAWAPALDQWRERGVGTLSLKAAQHPSSQPHSHSLHLALAGHGISLLLVSRANRLHAQRGCGGGSHPPTFPVRPHIWPPPSQIPAAPARLPSSLLRSLVSGPYHSGSLEGHDRLRTLLKPFMWWVPAPLCCARCEERAAMMQPSSSTKSSCR